MNELVYDNVEDIHARYTTDVNIDTGPGNDIFVIYGYRNTGKTTLAKNIICLTKPDIVMVSDTDLVKEGKAELEDMNYMKVNPVDLITTTYEVVKSNKKHHILLWLRDADIAVSGGKFFNNVELQNMIVNRSKYNLSIIIEMQYCSGIPPNIRIHIDHVFIFKCNRINELKKYYEYYLGDIDFSSYHKANKNMDDNAVINNYKGTTRAIKYPKHPAKIDLQKLEISKQEQVNNTVKTDFKRELTWLMT